MDYNLLKELTSEIAIYGSEYLFKNKLAEILKKLNLDYQVDQRNTFLVGNFSKPKIILGAHYDEVGLEINKVNDNGSLSFFIIGNIPLYHLVFQKVEIINKNGEKILGYINNKSLFTKESNQLSIEDLEIYIGAKNKEEVYQKFKIEEGCFGSFRRDYEEKENFIIAPAIDNRISLFVLLNTYLQLPQQIQKEVGLIFYSSEEFGCYSQDNLANNLKSDFIIIVDYCPANIEPRAKPTHIDNYPILGKGPVVFYGGDNYLLSESMKKILEGFDYQKGLFFNLVSAESGRFVRYHPFLDLTILIPALGYHSTNYLVLKEDIEKTINFIKKLLEKIIKQ